MPSTSLKQIKTLLTPSWLSGLFDVVVWLVIIADALIGRHFAGSIYQQGLFDIGSSSANTYQQLTAKVAQNRVIGNLPLFVFWLGVGMIVYYFATAIYTALSDAEKLREEMNYTNVRRDQLIRRACLHLVLRAIVLLAWVGYIAWFFKHLLPFVLSRLQSFSSAAVIEHALLAMLVLLVCLHLHTVLLRLVLLRDRLR